MGGNHRVWRPKSEAFHHSTLWHGDDQFSERSPQQQRPCFSRAAPTCQVASLQQHQIWRQRVAHQAVHGVHWASDSELRHCWRQWCGEDESPAQLHDREHPNQPRANNLRQVFLWVAKCVDQTILCMPTRSLLYNYCTANLQYILSFFFLQHLYQCMEREYQWHSAIHQDRCVKTRVGILATYIHIITSRMRVLGNE